MTDLFADVGAFHEKFRLPTFGAAPQVILIPDILNFRFKFMTEELLEFLGASLANDLAGACDALCDLVYVALGTAHLMGIDFNAHWALVQLKNMQKERRHSNTVDPRSKRGHILDVVKPAGWTPPDHTDILNRTQKAWEVFIEPERHKTPSADQF